jgi:branched-chain amino acid transport system permease protein
MTMPEGTDILNALVLMTNFVFVPALAYGSQLALGALGVTLVFGILRFANFAHGDLMAFGTTITILFTWAAAGARHHVRRAADGLLALIPAIVVTAIAAILIDKAVFSFYRKRRAAPVVFVIASVGVMFMLSPSCASSWARATGASPTASASSCGRSISRNGAASTRGWRSRRRRRSRWSSR